MTSKQHTPLQISSINENNWQSKKHKLMKRFAYLTERDLDLRDGRMNDLVDRIHFLIGKPIGKNREGIQRYLESL